MRGRGQPHDERSVFRALPLRRSLTMETRRAGEIRALTSNRIEGVAMRYGTLATIEGGRRERFLPGAFAPLPDAIDLTLQHDPGSVVGRVTLTDSPTELRAAGEVTGGRSRIGSAAGAGRVVGGVRRPR